jgi:membrane dipeptidase
VEDPWTPRVLKDLRASGLTAVNLTLGHVSAPGDPFEATVRDLARTARLLRRHAEAVLPVLAASDIRMARATRRTGIILGFQNTLMLGTDPGRVDTFSGLGVRIIQLTYNLRNLVGDGSMVPENRGLTDFGRQVVARLNASRTLVDLSHSGERTCLEALEAGSRPSVISHSACRDLCDLPRNKTDQELKLLADRGGVIGIFFMPYLKADGFPDAGDLVRHVEHAIQVCGEDHVGLGTDGGTTPADDLDAVREAVAREVAARKAAGIGAKGEKPGVLPFLPDLQGPEQFRRFAGLMRARGHSTARLEKILGGNFLRVMRDVWGS